MWNWLENLLQLISLHGFPLVAAALFLVAVPLALRSLWAEYRRLTRRHQELLSETSRLMELAAWEKGIGACWVGAKDNETICRLLRIPEDLQLFSVLALGIPDEEPVVEDADDDVSAKRDADGRLHVKKRKLDAICHVNRYGEKK